jgi:hypothetical protein
MLGPEREAVGRERWVVWIAAGVLLSGFGAELLRDFTPAKSSVLFMLLAMPVLLVIHELGHAAMAAALGWKICRVVIGYGRPLLRLHVGDVPTEIRLLPIAGHVLPAPLRLVRPRLENVLIYAAGPGAEVLLVLLLASLVGFDTLLEPAGSLAIIAVQSVALLVAIDVFTNLVPLPVQADGASVWTDGLGMLASPFLPRWHFRRALTLPWVLRAEGCVEAEDRVRVFEQGLVEHPDNPFMRLQLASAVEELNPMAARAQRQQALDSGELPEQIAADVRKDLPL